MLWTGNSFLKWSLILSNTLNGLSFLGHYGAMCPEGRSPCVWSFLPAGHKVADLGRSRWLGWGTFTSHPSGLARLPLFGVATHMHMRKTNVPPALPNLPAWQPWIASSGFTLLGREVEPNALLVPPLWRGWFRLGELLLSITPGAEKQNKNPSAVHHLEEGESLLLSSMEGRSAGWVMEPSFIHHIFRLGALP